MSGLRGEMTHVGIAQQHVWDFLAQTFVRRPARARQIDGTGHVPLLEVFRFADIHYVDVLVSFERVAEFHGAGGVMNFVMEVLMCPLWIWFQNGLIHKCLLSNGGMPLMATSARSKHLPSDDKKETAGPREQACSLQSAINGTNYALMFISYSCLVVLPGIGTGYLPSLSATMGGGESMVHLSMPGAYSISSLSISS